MFECPQCGQTLATAAGVRDHLLQFCLEHFDPDPRKPAQAICWCGDWFSDTITGRLVFEDHLEEHGGLTAHYLAHLLGVD